LLSDEDSEILEPLLDGANELRFWGFRENSRIKKDMPVRPPQSWARMPPGTMLVFVNSVNVSHTGVIGGRIYNPVLSEALWNSDEFSWVVGLLDVRSITGVTSSALRERAGFRRIQMAMPVALARRSGIHRLLSIGGGLTTAQATSAASSAAATETFDSDSPLSARVEAERRLEQGWLRGVLIPAPQGTCDLCGDAIRLLSSAPRMSRSALYVRRTSAAIRPTLSSRASSATSHLSAAGSLWMRVRTS
jgi:hypothetical protein